MSNVSFDRLIMKSDCDHSQIIASLASLDINSTGIVIEVHERSDLDKHLRPMALPLTAFPPVVAPDDRTIWQYAIRCVPVPPKHRLQDIRIPMPRKHPQLCKSHFLAVRQMRRLRTYMSFRLALIIDSIRLAPLCPPSHIATAEACVAFLHDCIKDCEWTEKMCLEKWKEMPEMDTKTWNDLCEAVAIFDKGWMKLAGVPDDRTVGLEKPRSLSIQQLYN